MGTSTGLYSRSSGRWMEGTIAMEWIALALFIIAAVGIATASMLGMLSWG